MDDKLIAWSLFFMVCAVIFAGFGFTPPDSNSNHSARLLFFISTATCLILLVMGLTIRG